jgi:hypothetical protein
MTDKLGKIKVSIQDARSGRLIFLSHCLLHFGKTSGVFAEELKAEFEARELQDLLFLTLPEVEEAGSISEALNEINRAVRSFQPTLSGRS